MKLEYDVFEQLPDGSPIWRGHVMGPQELKSKLEEIARQTNNECFAIHLPTQEIVSRVNVARRDRQPQNPAQQAHA